MKQIILLFIAVACTVLSAIGQVFQNFETASTLTLLTANCWQFKGASLTPTSTASTKGLALNTTTTGGTAWIKTPYIDLKTSSAISLMFKLSGTLPHGASRTITVYLRSKDGTITPVSSTTLDENSAATLSTLTANSPLSGTHKVEIEVTAVGNETTPVYLHNISIDGSFNFKPPYDCKEQNENPVSIHYLKKFSGWLSGNKIQLQWTVAENINNNYFEVERSTDGVTYKTIAMAWASSQPGEEAYSYSDAAQASAYYRLKVVSKGNVRMYSNVLVFKFRPGASTGLTLLHNPVRHNLSFSFATENTSAARLAVYNVSGNIVYQENIPAQKGHNVFTMPLPGHLRNGIYMMELVYGAERNTAKFVKE